VTRRTAALAFADHGHYRQARDLPKQCKPARPSRISRSPLPSPQQPGMMLGKRNSPMKASKLLQVGPKGTARQAQTSLMLCASFTELSHRFISTNLSQRPPARRSPSVFQPADNLALADCLCAGRSQKQYDKAEEVIQERHCGSIRKNSMGP